MKDATFFAFVVGFLGATGMFHAIHTDSLEAVEKENRVLKAKLAPLSFECPAPMIKVAMQADGGLWVKRCVMAGKVRAM